MIQGTACGVCLHGPGLSHLVYFPVPYSCKFHFPLQLNKIPSRHGPHFIIHSSLDGHLGWLRVCSAVDRTALTADDQATLQ